MVDQIVSAAENTRKLDKIIKRNTSIWKYHQGSENLWELWGQDLGENGGPERWSWWWTPLFPSWWWLTWKQHLRGQETEQSFRQTYGAWSLEPAKEEGFIKYLRLRFGTFRADIKNKDEQEIKQPSQGLTLRFKPSQFLTGLRWFGTASDPSLASC